MHVTDLPLELQFDILGYLNCDFSDQIQAATAYPLWGEIISSQPFLKSHYYTRRQLPPKHTRPKYWRLCWRSYSKEPAYRFPGVHRLVDLCETEGVCIFAGKDLKSYLYNGEDIIQSPVLDEPLFAPWISDSDLAQAGRNRLLPPLGRDFELDTFIFYMEYASSIKRSKVTDIITEPAEAITVRQFIQQLFLWITAPAPRNKRMRCKQLRFSYNLRPEVAAYVYDSDPHHATIKSRREYCLRPYPHRTWRQPTSYLDRRMRP
ncbi:hypothetical protein TWF696_000398 [Orbilia brochopaga]|uniref:F-box domain-containing protein n=1 Tax=Orbilia brochopaga TaxID=3140254 RepID=A0AAV9VDX7_9PEZI